MGHVSQLLLKNVEARRFLKVSPDPVQVRIDNNLAVTVIRPEQTGAHVEFNYTAVYGPLGVIKIEGEFLYSGDLAQQTIKEWEQKKQMPGEAASEIHTTIMHACLPEAVALARSVQLPPPIPMPIVKFEKKPDTPPAPMHSPEVG
jgi:hypothetical protein